MYSPLKGRHRGSARICTGPGRASRSSRTSLRWSSVKGVSFLHALGRPERRDPMTAGWRAPMMPNDQASRRSSRRGWVPARSGRGEDLPGLSPVSDVVSGRGRRGRRPPASGLPSHGTRKGRKHTAGCWTARACACRRWSAVGAITSQIENEATYSSRPVHRRSSRSTGAASRLRGTVRHRPLPPGVPTGTPPPCCASAES